MRLILSLLFLSLTASRAEASLAFVTATAATANSTTVSFLHTVSSGSDRITVVGVAISSTATVLSVSYAGSGFTRLTTLASISNKSELWYLLAPSVTSQNITVTVDVSGRIVAGAATYTGADPFSPWGGLGGTVDASSTNVSTTVTTTFANSVIIDHVSCDPGVTITFYSTLPMVTRWNEDSGTIVKGAGLSLTTTGTGAFVINHTLSGASYWVQHLSELKETQPTATPTWTPTWTPTNTPLPTRTFTVSKTPTPTRTPTWTPTTSPTRTITRTHTFSPTISATLTISPTPTISPTFTVSPTRSATFTISPTYSLTHTVSPTISATKTPRWTLKPTPVPVTWTTRGPI